MASKLKIAQRKISGLTSSAHNARTHGERQIGQIAKSIEQFGFVNPVLVSSTGEIIAGHGRVAAAESLGIESVPVIVLDGLTDAQTRALRLADNRIALNAGWDDDKLSTELQALLDSDVDVTDLGFSEAEVNFLVESLADDPLEDDIPELPAQPVSKTGDLWILGNHRLLCGDSTSEADVKRLMEGERAILFATDPPYLVGYSGGNHPHAPGDPNKKKKKNWDDTYGVTWDDADQTELWSGFIAQAIAQAIAQDAAWYCWHASIRAALLESTWEKYGTFVHQQIIWKKNRPVLTYSHYLWAHEPCFFGWRKGNKPPKVTKGQLSTIWEMDAIRMDESGDGIEHPTPKPLDAFGIPMRQHVRKGGLCYEPFSGSGSQIMAGEVNERRVFAMDIEPAYIDVAVERWENYTGGKARKS